MHSGSVEAPDWTAILGAVSAAISALVLVIGAWFAQRYLARGNTAFDAEVFRHATGLGLHVRPAIQSLGLSALRLSHEDELAPAVEVYEYRYDGSPGDGVRRETFMGDDLVGPGETITDSEVFLVSVPGATTLGWRVIFEVGVQRRFRRPAWRWVAATFVPVPKDPAEAGSRQVELPGSAAKPGGDGDGGEVLEQGQA